VADDRIQTPETAVAAESPSRAGIEPASHSTGKIPLTPRDRSWFMSQIEHWRKLGLMNDGQAHTILGIYEERWGDERPRFSIGTESAGAVLERSDCRPFLRVPP